MYNNYFDITGKHILVTGASSGIGREVAIQLSLAGAIVSVTGRSQDKLSETVINLDPATIAYSGAHDLTDDESIKQLVSSCNNLDGVVFCAGIAEYTPIKVLSSNKLQNTLNTNFISQAQLTTLLLKNRKLNADSSLVYISSISSRKGVAATAAYASSKAALSAFVRVLATEVAKPNRIRVNSLCPGIVKTPMGQMVADLVEDISADYPLGLGDTIDIANSCIFFLSDASKWITGTELVLDGGLTLT